MEEYCVGLSLRVALKFCDSVVVLVHASTDRTIEIVREIEKETNRVIVAVDDDPVWHEMRHRQVLLDLARADGATHIFIADCDEILSANLIPTIRRNIELMSAGSILQLPGYNLRAGIDRYHGNGLWGNRWFSAAFVDDPCLGWAGDKFHSREPHGARLQPYRSVGQGVGGLVHLWGASERRLRAKHALYKVTERLRWPDKSVDKIDREYSWAIHSEQAHQIQFQAFGTPTTWTYKPVPTEWWAVYEAEGLMQYLDVDAVPYQEALVREAIAKHGHEPFYGLDLFGCTK
jgi:hypothetical protein